MEKFINGVDVSRWQGTDINWKKVKADGFLFSFMKATDGTAYSQKFIDMGIKQATDAKAAGLKLGYYHFAHPANINGVEKDATAEASYFLKVVKTFPKFNFPLVLDIEDEQIKLTPDETEQWILQFRKVIQAAGHELILYSYANYLNRNLPANHQLDILPLWLASYPRVFDINKFPKNPRGWSSWVAWQYTDKGKPDGFTTTGCDLNVMTKTFFDQF